MIFYFRPHIADFGYITTHGCHSTAMPRRHRAQPKIRVAQQQRSPAPSCTGLYHTDTGAFTEAAPCSIYIEHSGAEHRHSAKIRLMDHFGSALVKIFPNIHDIERLL